ncbi:hypothetical protein KKY_1886 [Pelagibacterium halotolerans B2]|uniref:BrnA antitoxin of type II toxin-antitoxin system n=2 Tax=Pelagibacterium TaxID=1082930 RepID=G4RES6_PELHB|nr:hypothetical protein KKY_1886 [Pelagibacterium halotolerans B2]
MLARYRLPLGPVWIIDAASSIFADRGLWPGRRFHLLAGSFILHSMVTMMAYTPRRPTSGKERAEALFRAATTKADEAPKPKTNPIPQGKEMVSLRIDRDVLEHFQDDGPGWQERINAALRKAAGLE